LPGRLTEKCHTHPEERHYTAQFSNTTWAHKLGITQVIGAGNPDFGNSMTCPLLMPEVITNRVAISL
jgi:hypothetical protein